MRYSFIFRIFEPQVNENLVIVLLNLQIPSPVEELYDPLYEAKGIRLFVKRDDLIHPVVSGNKWRKLKYALSRAKEMGYDTVLSFGGAYSNHIHALAEAAKAANLKAIGIIRGEELGNTLNPTLTDAQNDGMKLHFISREAYRRKEETDFITVLQKQFGNFYLIPEGGKSAEGFLGCREIVSEITIDYDYVVLACGTGTTLAGVIQALPEGKRAIGIPVVKDGNFLEKDIHLLVGTTEKTNWEIKTEYHFGGYAKTTPELLSFISDFETRHGLLVDPVYVGKLFFGVTDLITKDFFPKGSSIVAVHTGGLQGKRA